MNMNYLDNNAFSIILIIDGDGSLFWESGSMEIKKGDEIFLPVGVKKPVIKTRGWETTISSKVLSSDLNK